MKLISLIISFAFLSSCAKSQNKDKSIQLGSKIPLPHEAVATFAEGCFWHTEIVFQSLTGVRDAVSGYSGGTDPKPDYERVCTGKTGHAEAVQVYYDPSVISYESLVKAFFASHDPTTLNRQGNDSGTQYRSVAFYRTENEKRIVETEMKRISESKKYNSKIVTQVVPFEKFYPAEEYHQDYFENNPNQPYCQLIVNPKVQKFKKKFASLLK